jgi:carbonic anhydrase
MTDAVQPADFLSPELTAGYEAFLSGRFLRERRKFHELAQTGQHPHTLVIGCSDSRVTPEEIFNALPGEIFDVRNVANLIPPCAPDNYHHGSWAAIDYAVTNLRVKHIVVLGHAKCGGVRAYVERHGGAADELATGDYIGDWIRLIGPAAQRLGPPPASCDEAYADRLAQESIKQGVSNLRTFPRVAEAERAGRLKLHGAFFGVDDARLLALDEAQGGFVQIARAAHRAALAAPRF